MPQCKFGHSPRKLLPSGRCPSCARLEARKGPQWRKDRKVALAKRRDQNRESALEWANKHPERLMLTAARARAKQKGVPCTITVDDIVIPDRCPALGITLRRGKGKCVPASPSLARIKPELGYVPGNVVVISHLANAIKSSATPEEVMRVAKYLEKLYGE